MAACLLLRAESRTRQELWLQPAAPGSACGDTRAFVRGRDDEHRAGHWPGRSGWQSPGGAYGRSLADPRSSEVTGLFASLLLAPSRTEGNGRRRTAIPVSRSRSAPDSDQGGSSVPPSPWKPTRLREGRGHLAYPALSATVSGFSGAGPVSPGLSVGESCAGTCHADQAALWWGVRGTSVSWAQGQP